MRRREFITLLSGVAAVAWPILARSQQSEQMRRIGVLRNGAADDPLGQAGLTAFRQVLQQLGWSEGRNMRIDIRYGENNAERFRRYAAELATLSPDVILAAGTPSVTAVQSVAHTVPIVFVEVSDPVAAGLVETLAHPGGNTTGFMNSEHSLSAKWLDLLKQIAPGVTRAAVLRDSADPAGIAQFSVLQAIAQSRGVEVSPVSVRDAGEIERAVAALARSVNGGVIETPSAGISVNRELIITLAARYKLPAVYADRYRAISGGLISYGPDRVEQHRGAAGYVDRILKGGKPADLPVQAPTKYQLVINLKTAKAIGLTMPAALLASADEVIE